MIALFDRGAWWLRILLFGLYMPLYVSAQYDPCVFPDGDIYGISSQADADSIAYCTTFVGALQIDVKNGSIILNGVQRLSGSLNITGWDEESLYRPPSTFQAPDLEYISKWLSMSSNFLQNATFNSLTTVGSLQIGVYYDMSSLEHLDFPAGLGLWSDESYSAIGTGIQAQSITIMWTNLTAFPNLGFTSATSVDVEENPYMTNLTLQIETLQVTVDDNNYLLIQDIQEPTDEISGSVNFPQLKNISIPFTVKAWAFSAPNLVQTDGPVDLQLGGQTIDLPNLVEISGDLTVSAQLTEASFPQLRTFKDLILGASDTSPLDLSLPSLEKGSELSFSPWIPWFDCGSWGEKWISFVQNGTIDEVWCGYTQEEPIPPKSHKWSTEHIIIATVVPIGLVFLAIVFVYKYWERQRERKIAANRATEAQVADSPGSRRGSPGPVESNAEDDEDIELPKYTPGLRPPTYSVGESSAPESREGRDATPGEIQLAANEDDTARTEPRSSAA